MIRFTDIDPFIKELGQEVLGYILNLSEEEAKALFANDYTLSSRQQAVLKELEGKIAEIEKVAVHRSDRNEYIYFCLSHLTTHASKHIFNDWRENLGGKVLSPVTDDDVVSALTALAIETYPALLLSTSNSFKNRVLRPAIPPNNHPANELFEAASLKDSSLSKLFTHCGRDANHTYGYFQNSTGRGGNLNLDFFATALIGAAHVLMRIRNNISGDALLKSVREVIQMVRRAINGEIVMVPTIIGFQNVALPSPFELELPFGMLRDIKSSVLQLLPYNARPPSMKQKLIGFVLENQYPYKLELSDQSSSMYLSDLSTLGYSEAQKELENIIDKVVLTFALGLKRDKPVGAVNSWTLTFDPLISWANIASKSFPFSAVPPYDVSEGDSEFIKEWASLVVSTDWRNIEIAVRRIIGAVTYRTDPVDGFIDSIIAWENIFGGSSSGELTFRVSTAMACLLENQIDARLRLQKELSDLYKIRSKIVHGSKHLDAAEAIGKRDRALSLILECVRKLFKEHRDLLADQNRSKKILLEKR